MCACIKSSGVWTNFQTNVLYMANVEMLMSPCVWFVILLQGMIVALHLSQEASVFWKHDIYFDAK